MRNLWRNILLVLVCLAATAPAARAERIEVLAHIKGMRPLRVNGQGLVVGLNGTGDKANASREALKRLLSKQNLHFSVDDLPGQNVALVNVTAEIPAFARPGSVVDVQVSSLVNTASLQNGILLNTILRARPDGPVMAMASGRVLVGGESQNDQFPTTGSIPASQQGGAQVVRGQDVSFLSDRNTFELLLKRPSFSTAHSIAQAINANSATNPDLERMIEQMAFDILDRSIPGPAQALDAGTVIVRIPEQYGASKVKYISTVLKDVSVDVDVPPRVVINRATNTVVITGEVRVDRVAIAHGDLSVVVEQASRNDPAQFQFNPQDQRSLVEVTDAGQGQTENLKALLATLNAMQTRPRDIITIIETLHRAGALHADLVTQ